MNTREQRVYGGFITENNSDNSQQPKLQRDF
jgi:hypothetical protein